MRAKAKLKNRKGFTLAETLLAVLIMLLVSGIMATGIPAARNAYLKVVVGSNAQALLSTAAALRDELGSAWNVEAEGNALTYYSADTGARSRIYATDKAIMIQEYVSEEGFNDREGISVGDERPLVSEKAATKDLAVTYAGATYEDGVVTFTNLSVKSGSAVLTSLATLKIRVFSAVPTVAP